MQSEVIHWPKEPVVLSAIEENILQRAYDLYEARGRKGGEELLDWRQAEAEIRAASATGKVIPFRPSAVITSSSPAVLFARCTLIFAQRAYCAAAILFRERLS